jgi:hypothetical protein
MNFGRFLSGGRRATIVAANDLLSPRSIAGGGCRVTDAGWRTRSARKFLNVRPSAALGRCGVSAGLSHSKGS